METQEWEKIKEGVLKLSVEDFAQLVRAYVDQGKSPGDTAMTPQHVELFDLLDWW